MFSLYEELFLLALDEEKGNFLPITKKTVPFGLTGAILAELMLSGRICTNEKGRLEVVDTAPSGDAVLDEIIQTLEAADKPHKLTYWVGYLSEHPKKLRIKLGEGLAAKNLVQQEENRFYWRTADNQNGEPALPSKFEMKNSLRKAIFTNMEPDSNSLALLNIAGACGLLNLVFTADELPMAQRRVHEIVMHAALKDPALQVLEEIEYAIAASIEDSSD